MALQPAAVAAIAAIICHDSPTFSAPRSVESAAFNLEPGRLMHPRILLLAACALALAACSDSDSDGAARHTQRRGTGRRRRTRGDDCAGAEAAADSRAAAGQGARLLPDGFHQRPGARGDERGPAAGAGEPDEADERIRGVPRAQGRPHQARRPGDASARTRATRTARACSSRSARW